MPIVRAELDKTQLNTEKVEGLHPEVWGDFSMIYGDVKGLRGPIPPGFTGNVTGLLGRPEGLIGDASRIFGRISDGLHGFINDLEGDISGIRGFLPQDLVGNITNVQGYPGRLYGDVSNIRGFISEGLRGPVTDISGDVTGLYGNAFHLRGDVTEATGDAADWMTVDDDKVPAAGEPDGVVINVASSDNLGQTQD